LPPYSRRALRVVSLRTQPLPAFRHLRDWGKLNGMAEFVCKVADASGRVYSQVEAAQSVAEARQKLSDRGLLVYQVRARDRFLGQVLGRRRMDRVRGNDFLVFNQQFNTLIKAGIPILKALDLLAERAAAPRLRPVLGEVRRLVREGTTLSDALEQQGVFPKVYTTSVLAGEKSGNLSGVLEYYIAYQRVSTGLRKKLIATLIYPAILICVATLVVTYLVSSVIPKFAALYKDLNVSLPGPTRILLTVTVTYRSFLLGAIGLLVLLALAAFAWSRTQQGGLTLERLRMRLPLLGQTLGKFQVAQFCRTLATLLAGGTPLVQAMETSGGAIRGYLVSGAIMQAAQSVREGQSLHNSLAATGLVPELALEMIEVGEASGALSPMLGSVSEFYEDEVNNRLTNLVALVEPVILVFMAVLIAFILVALYLPMFSVSVGATGG
jgi:type IV pilus assembly protein PilC